MNFAKLCRGSGLFLLVGSIAFVVHVVLRSFVTAGVEPCVVAKHGFWVPLNALGLFGAVLVLLALPIMCAVAAEPIGRLGLAGMVLIAIAWTFFGVFLSLYALLLLPWLANEAPSLVSAGKPLPAGVVVSFIIGLVAWLSGAILLAIPFIRGRLRPRWAGYLLAASAAWIVVGNLVIAPKGPPANVLVNLMANLAPVLLLVGFGYVGYLMWMGRFQMTKLR